MFVAALYVGELRIAISTAGRVIQGHRTCLNLLAKEFYI
jgi:hypothetical protein